jgi:hypothetical protein
VPLPVAVASSAGARLGGSRRLAPRARLPVARAIRARKRRGGGGRRGGACQWAAKATSRPAGVAGPGAPGDERRGLPLLGRPPP